jgi:tetratricopeptide (TPR) repeat protein
VRWGRYQHRLASGHASVGNPDDAVRHAQRATLHLQNGGASSRELAAAFDTVAACHHQRGDLDAAARARCQAVTTLEQDAASSTDCVLALTRLADLRRLQGLYADAENLLTRTLAKVPDGDRGEQMTSRALVLNALGIVYKDTGRYIAANHAYNTALGLIIAAHGPDDPATAPLWHNLAGLAQARGHPHQAIPLATSAVELRERQLGPHHCLVAEDLAVSRDDLVFREGTLHISVVNGDFNFSLNPRTCVFSASIQQTGAVEGGTGRYAAAAGSFTGSVTARGVLRRTSDGTCSQDHAPVIEVDTLTADGSLSL